MTKWFPIVMMKQKMNLMTRGLLLNQNKTESTGKRRRTRSHSEKNVHGKSKQMIASTMDNLTL